MSDDQLFLEYEAQKIMADALKYFREAIARVNEQSAIVNIDIHHLDDFVADFMPSETQWNESIAQARMS